MRRLFLGVALIIVLAGQGAPPSFDDGLLAYSRGNHLKAFEIWRPMAEGGHASAQYMLGYLYQRGEGVLPDPKTAARWYRKAANQGDPDAQLNLGLLYALGQGVKRDFVQAYKWFSLAYVRYPPGQYRENAFRNRENAASVLTEEQIERAERLVRRWKPK